MELIAILLASAERRSLERAFGIAALRAYRTMDIIPQRRLAIRGEIDPSRVDWGTLAARAGLWSRQKPMRLILNDVVETG